MFVISFKASKRQLISMILCVIMLIAVIVVAILWPIGGASAKQTYAPVTGGSDNERTAFLTKLGYEVDSQNQKVKEVLIPDEFDDVFAKYNTVQKQAGMDLQPYHGKRVKVWTYKVLNVPDTGEVYANLFVYKDKIIGGDVSSTALNGFMHGLTPYGGNGDQVTATAAGATLGTGKASGAAVGAAAKTASGTTKKTAAGKQTAAKSGTTRKASAGKTAGTTKAAR